MNDQLNNSHMKEGDTIGANDCYFTNNTTCIKYYNDDDNNNYY